jgi:hypothetical protein
MNLDHYTYFANGDFLYYTFYSDGPRGKIKKVVEYKRIAEKPSIYNLAFGDQDIETGLVSDVTISDNKDRDKVLATVANTVIDFYTRHGNHHIYIKGSTPARTRLYQMGISRIWNDICADFDLYGLKAGQLQRFQPNVNYESFLFKRK